MLKKFRRCKNRCARERKSQAGSLTPTPAVLDSSTDGAGHHATSTTCSGPPIAGLEARISVGHAATTEQQSESTQRARDEQQPEAPEPVVEIQAQDTAHLETSPPLRNKDPELHLDLSPAAHAEPEPRESLWDEAYALTQERDQKLVRRYETILSADLEQITPGSEQQQDSPLLVAPENVISQTSFQVRRAQMEKLLKSWLDDTDKDKKRKHMDIHVDEDSITKSTISLGEIIAKTLEKTPPEAVIVWVGACYASRIIIQDPTAANENDCSGIIRVISRMEWYGRLPRLLSEDGKGEDDSASWELRGRVVDLYAAVLAYVMTVVCSNCGRFLFDFSRDAFCLSPGPPMSQKITEAEDALSLFNQDRVKLPLEYLLRSTRKQQAPSTRELETEQPSEENRGLLDDLHVVDPRPRRVNQPDPEQGRAMSELYGLLLNRDEYRDFCDWEKQDSQLLWISAGPGQGKTMLLTRVVQALSGRGPDSPDARFLSFFFFEYHSPGANNAAAALRNLIWLLLVQQPSLSTHLEKKRKTTGRRYFDSQSDFVALSAVFCDMVQDDNFSETYLVVDALDECPGDGPRPELHALVRLIVRSMQVSRKIRWLVSSNYGEPMKSNFDTCAHRHLALGADIRGPRAAMYSYIRREVSCLAAEKSYDEKLETRIISRLCEQPPDNYLWVHIVCAALLAGDTVYAETLLEDLRTRRDLGSLYSHLEYKTVNTTDKKSCFEVLSIMAIVQQSLHLAELTDLLHHVAPRVDLMGTLQKCSAFLQVRGDVVSFHHRSARDHVREKMADASAASSAHAALTRGCLESLASSLSKDVRLPQPAHLRGGRTADRASVASSYASLHWMRHLSEISNADEGDKTLESVLWFLKEHFLAWVDALVSGEQLSLAVVRLQQADLVLQDKLATGGSDNLHAATREAHLFLRLHQSTDSPKEVPASNTLLFCPEESMIRQACLQKAFPWMSAPPATDQRWTHDFASLRGHQDWVRAIAFSADGRLMASGSDDSTVRIWDAATGTTQHTLPIQQGWVYSVAFSSGGTVAAGSDDYSITLWESSTGRELKRLPGHAGTINALAFSPDGSKLAAASSWTVRVWDVGGGDPQTWGFEEIEGHTDYVRCLAFSQDGAVLATGADDCKIRLWDVNTRVLRRVLDGHTQRVNSVAYSPPGPAGERLLASGSQDGTIRVWDAEDGREPGVEEGKGGEAIQPLRVLEGRSEVNSVAFSPDGSRLASATDSTIDIWAGHTGARLQALRARDFNVWSVAFAPPAGAYLASGSIDTNIHLWYARAKDEDAASGPAAGQFGGHLMAVSPDGRTVAGVQAGVSVIVWDAEPARPVPRRMQVEHQGSLLSLVFSPDSRRLLSTSVDLTVQVCDVATGRLLHVFRGHTDWVRCAAWSAGGDYVASASDDGSIMVWKAGGEEGQEPTAVLREAHEGSCARAVAFSPDGKYLVSGGSNHKVRVWKKTTRETWEPKHNLVGHTDLVLSLLVTRDSSCVLSASPDGTLRTWDLVRGEETSPPVKIDWAFFTMWYPPGSTGNEKPGCVMTPQGIQSLRPRSGHTTQPPAWSPWRLRYDSQSRTWWITFEDQNVVFLPEKFHPASALVLGEKVVIGTPSNHVYIYGFSKDHLPHFF